MTINMIPNKHKRIWRLRPGRLGEILPGCSMLPGSRAACYSAPQSRDGKDQYNLDRLSPEENAAFNEQVPSMYTPIPLTGVSGLAHGGFTTAQIASSWSELVNWTEMDQQR
jgi:hypothetical protein